MVQLTESTLLACGGQICCSLPENEFNSPVLHIHYNIDIPALSTLIPQQKEVGKFALGTGISNPIDIE